MENSLEIFKDASSDLFKMILKVSRQMATEANAPQQFEAHNACRLVPLDENPGVRQLGIGKVLRRIFGCTITGPPGSLIEKATLPWEKKKN